MEEADYDTALAEVEALLKAGLGMRTCTSSGRTWCSCKRSQHELDEAKQALQQAVELDKGSPAAAIELGHFLDNVEDDPQGASKAYAEGVAAARRLLIDGLIGQAKVFRQLNKRQEFLRCLLEVLQLTQFETARRGRRHHILTSTSSSARQRAVFLSFKPKVPTLNRFKIY